MDLIPILSVFARGWAALALLALAAPAAAAAEREVETVWRIGAASPPAAPVQVRSGGEIWRQPLVPEGVVILAGPAVTTRNGKTIIAAGRRLIKARSDVPVYCDLDAHKAGAGESFLMGSVGERTACLIDRDADGRFDGYFGNKVQFEGFPVVRGRYPDKADPIEPIAYAPADPAEAVRDHWIAVEYRGTGLSGDRFFRIAFYGPKDKSALSQWAALPSSGLPAEATMLGGRFTLLAAGQGSVTVRVDRAMPEQPFNVVRTFSYR
jgi:hypothetical protein